MILPTKHISIDNSMLGVGAILLRGLEEPRTVTGLWELTRRDEHVSTFKRFVLGLDLLYTLGAIEVADGMLTRNTR